MTRESTYKPLLFTTTVRNPERLKGFLRVLAGYDGRALDDALATKVAEKAVATGLYSPKKMSREAKEKIKNKKELTKAEIAKILKDNPQRHKEAGFSRGWPSRFDTWFKFAKELGFVFYRAGEKIKFSRAGLTLIEKPEFEQSIFLNAFVKYQSNNPFRRVLNENIPLILLLRVIQHLNADSQLNGAGISKWELPLLLCWKNDDAKKLYQRIKKLRREFGYSPSGEVIIDICKNEIMRGEDIIRDAKSILVDYPDEFIRKMRLTGLISLRGGGRFVDINENEQKRISYVLKKYSKCGKYRTEKQYFKHMSVIDKNLLSIKPKKTPLSVREKMLAKWVEKYSWEDIKREILNLAGKGLSRDETLKYLTQPVRLEFLTALAIKSKFPNVKVIPNYSIDDEGIPVSTAAGADDTGDIECFENSNGILVEVTMLEGRTQTVNEVWPIGRHLGKFSGKVENAVCYFIAPSIFADSLKQIRFLKFDDDLDVSPKTIREFVDYVEKRDILYSVEPR